MATGGRNQLDFLSRTAALFTAAVVVLAGCVSGSEAPSSLLSPDEQAFQDGEIARCNEGGYSDNTDFSATCSSAGDVDEWLGEFGRCKDGRIIALNEDTSCDDNDGFDAVMPAGFAPDASAADVARCNDGTYSDNTDFSATCSSADGIDEWLTQYGRCDDSVVIVMSDKARCDDGFDELIADDVELIASNKDLAQCVNGTFSDNTNLRAICSANGGVAKWLANYVECTDGNIVELDKNTKCDIAALRPDYTPPTTTTMTGAPVITTAGETATTATTAAAPATTEFVLTPDDVREFVFPISFESNRDQVVEILNSMTAIRSVDSYDYIAGFGVVGISATPEFDFDAGVRDDAWDIMRGISLFWSDLWYDPASGFSPTLDVSISTAQYQCSGDQMRRMADARFSRADWEAGCRVR